MHSKKYILNRNKLSRFVDSLKVRTSEEIYERQRIGDEYFAAEQEFQAIRQNVNSVIHPKSYTKRNRPAYTDSRIKQKPIPTFETEYNNDNPKYIPASKYALPMIPIEMKPSNQYKNAARILNLSRLRPKKPYSEVNPDDFLPQQSLPGVNIEKIEVSSARETI